MAGKKGVTPAHVKPLEANHPKKEHPIVAAFECLPEPRKPTLFFKHPLSSIMFIVWSAVTCGADDWAEVLTFAEAAKAWIAQYVDLSGGIPCERTLKTVFNALDPDALEGVLREISGLIRKQVEGELISFDGQTMRGTSTSEKKGLHLVHAWSRENGLCLGQMKVDDKSNEITALPKLMEQLALRNTVVIADAMNTQRATIAKAVECGADYVFPVKENQAGLLEEIQLAFKELDASRVHAQALWERKLRKAEEKRDKQEVKKLKEEGASKCGCSEWVEVEKGHGRVEKRRYRVITAKGLPAAEKWQKLQRIVECTRERSEGEKTTQEVSYYITSLQVDAEALGGLIRGYWSVENQLHWRLDVIFRQDNATYRDRIGARNFATIRKLSLNSLMKDKSRRASVKCKRYAAACDPLYRSRLLENFF